MRPSKPNWISDLAGVGVLAKRVFSPAYKHGVGKKLCLLWALWWSMHSWDMCLHWLWHMSLLSALETWGERGKIILESVYSCAHAKLLPPQNLYHQKKKKWCFDLYLNYLSQYIQSWMRRGRTTFGGTEGFLRDPLHTANASDTERQAGGWVDWKKIQDSLAEEVMSRRIFVLT